MCSTSASGGSLPCCFHTTMGTSQTSQSATQQVSSSNAAAALTDLGLHAGGPYGPSDSTTVVSTKPAAGSSVPVGSTVQVYTG